LCAIKEDKSMDCHVIKEGKKATQKRSIRKSPKIRYTNYANHQDYKGGKVK